MGLAATLFETPSDGSDNDAVRRCVRDLVALSSLPSLWIHADGQQIAESLAMVVLTLLDVDVSYVELADPPVEVLRHHERWTGKKADAVSALRACEPNQTLEFEGAPFAAARATCVPIGPGARRRLIVVSRRENFPDATEQMLLRVAANQAGISLQRWSVEDELRRRTAAKERVAAINAGLLQLTDRLFRAQDLNEIHQAALSAICDTLACDRASILLFDKDGVMRFVAWRGLSADYRTAVTGHTPWSPQDRDAKPIFINDIRQGDVSTELKNVIVSEGIIALGFIPIIMSGRVAGKFMTYYDAPRLWDSHEEDVAISIARQLGFSLERWRGDEARNLLVGELSHRVKNTLSTVMSIARHSFANAGSIAAARQSLESRIRALAHTHGQLAEANWSGVSIKDLIQDELAPYRSDGDENSWVRGPPIMLNPKGAVVLGMAFHELATNAAKHGSLSIKRGKVDVQWSMQGDSLIVEWTERGGPAVVKPTHSGFGRLLLERAVASDLCGAVNLDFCEQGLRCAITVPLNQCGATL